MMMKSNVVWFFIFKKTFDPILNYFDLFHGTSHLILRLYFLWIFKTFNFIHFHKEFKTILV
jgi:hypothetical protein